MKARSPHALRAGSEAALAAWWAGGRVVGHDLPTHDGHIARVLFVGRAGGNAGPDFRDAVMLLDGVRLVGDIELHLRATNWYAHHHQRDPRYDGVVLHVVAAGTLPPGAETRLASGRAVPVILLSDHAPRFAHPAEAPRWPCHENPLPATTRTLALQAWGRARFAERVAHVRAKLATGVAPEAVLLAEMRAALHFGRQDLHAALPLRSVAPAPPLVDRLTTRRLRAFGELVGDWHEMPVVARICGATLAGGATGGWERLLALFAPAGRAIGTRRAAIVLWNATLPFLAAYGDHCGNRALAATARAIAAAAPGLPANAITRAMTRWWDMPHLPPGALAQQGLHHIHAHWCRAKLCATCPAAGEPQPSRQRR